jgi:outer membrane PBP1 activator LpoA protein
MQVNRKILKGCLVLIAALLVASCTTGGGVRDPGRLSAQATKLEQRGDYQEAATIYLRLARSSKGAERDRYLVAAAFDLYQSGEDERARDALQGVVGPLQGSALSRWALLGASLALLRHEPLVAVELLGKLPIELSRADQAWAYLLRAKSSFQFGQPRNGIEFLVFRENLLPDENARENNLQEIWNGLQQVPLQDLQDALSATEDPLVAGWLNLAAVARLADRNPFEFKSGIANWRNQHPGHPADGALLLRIIDAYRISTEYPQQVALLLPISGRQQSAALAIREGFMAAYFQQTDASLRPDIRIYDVNELGPEMAYRLAIVEGADFVVGPLTRPAVAAVAENNVTQVGTLALNFLGRNSGAPDGFYQFALVPEDEARAVARRIAALGLTRGLALVPNNDWGMRLIAAFEDELQIQGGELLDYRAYEVGVQDFSSTITRLLMLTESRSRRSRLQSTLGVRLEFEPRRRQDTEFVFLAARPAQGRQIKPQLKYHYAADLPVFSTSAIFSPGNANNRLLNGVSFADMPWMIDPDLLEGQLSESVNDVWPALASRGRLFAMGFDAYRMVPLLHRGSFGDRPIAGMSGTLWLDSDRRIRRDLDWAEIDNGKPRLLPPLINDFSDPGMVDSSVVAEPPTPDDDQSLGN